MAVLTLDMPLYGKPGDCHGKEGGCLRRRQAPTAVRGTAERGGSMVLAVGRPAAWLGGQPGASGQTGGVLGLGTAEGAGSHVRASREGQCEGGCRMPRGPPETVDDRVGLWTASLAGQLQKLGPFISQDFGSRASLKNPPLIKDSMFGSLKGLPSSLLPPLRGL